MKKNKKHKKYKQHIKQKGSGLAPLSLPAATLLSEETSLSTATFLSAETPLTAKPPSEAECSSKQGYLLKIVHALCSIVLCVALVLVAAHGIDYISQYNSMQKTRQAMAEEIAKASAKALYKDKSGMPAAGAAEVLQNAGLEIAEDITGQQTQDGQAAETAVQAQKEEAQEAPQMLPQYASLYESNSDMVGWLKIEDTVIDYPVMQTPENEDYYLEYDFYKEKNKNGCLILDTDSTAGDGTLAQEYEDGSAPSDNLIIHGHTMKSGAMFGGLKKYAEEDYGMAHKTIRFDTLYEEREYELISAFYSQVYNKQDDVFKYYQFFNADNKEQFDNWYDNIKALSLYDTGVTAEYGDEFITLSCCAYHIEDGRFVVVGKRIK